ncbi:MAG: DUF5676 family membrane protein [Pseudomonadota bacterium]|jgi:hypothetical protein
MQRHDPLAIGLSLSVTAGLLYLICALTVVLAPGAFTAALAKLFHGPDLSALLTPNPPAPTLGAVGVGTLLVMIYAFFAGWLFDFVHRRFTRGSRA